MPDLPSAPTARNRGRIFCYGLIGIAVVVLAYFEIGKPTLSEDPILQRLITMTARSVPRSSSRFCCIRAFTS